MCDAEGPTRELECGDDDESRLPSWFLEGAEKARVWGEDRTAAVQLLASVRSDVYSALGLYHQNVKYATTLVISLLTIIAAGLSAARVVGGEAGFEDARVALETGTYGLLVVAGVVSSFAIVATTRYYNVYVAALIFGSQVHFGLGLQGFYWFDRVAETVESMNRKGRDSRTGRREYIRRRTWSCKDSHFWYTLFLVVIGGLALAVRLLGLCNGL